MLQWGPLSSSVFGSHIAHLSVSICMWPCSIFLSQIMGRETHCRRHVNCLNCQTLGFSASWSHPKWLIRPSATQHRFHFANAPRGSDSQYPSSISFCTLQVSCSKFARLTEKTPFPLPLLSAHNMSSSHSHICGVPTGQQGV